MKKKMKTTQKVIEVKSLMVDGDIKRHQNSLNFDTYDLTDPIIGP